MDDKMICAYCQRPIEDGVQRIDVLGALDTPPDAHYHVECFNKFMEHTPHPKPPDEDS